MKKLLLIVGLVGCLVGIQAEELCVVSYNVENLFHPKHDTVVERVRGLEVSGLEVSGLEVRGLEEIFIEKDDWEWTPEGERHWSYTRYYRKVENIARVLTNIGEWDGVDVAGLQEVENALCLKRLCRTLRLNEYDFVHYESPDQRGIDVALIYKKSRIDTIATRAIPVSGLEVSGLEDELITRDILYVCAKIKAKSKGLKVNGDTIHFFVCHLPSQRGGVAESEWKRNIAKQVLQRAVDSVFAEHQDAKIIVMGDMNSEPKDDIIGLKNRMRKPTPNPSLKGRKNNDIQGTHKYQGQWTCLDQFYTSPAVDSISDVHIYDAEWIMEPDEKYMGLKPKRTYNGFRYQDGYSDHLPIILNLR